MITSKIILLSILGRHSFFMMFVSYQFYFISQFIYSFLKTWNTLTSPQFLENVFYGAFQYFNRRRNYRVWHFVPKRFPPLKYVKCFKKFFRVPSGPFSLGKIFDTQRAIWQPGNPVRDFPVNFSQHGTWHLKIKSHKTQDFLMLPLAIYLPLKYFRKWRQVDKTFSFKSSKKNAAES